MRLHQGAFCVIQLIVNCQLWNLNHPVPLGLTHFSPPVGLSPFEEIDSFENLLDRTCIKFSRWLTLTISSLQVGKFPTLSIIETVIILTVEYGSAAYNTQGKPGMLERRLNSWQDLKLEYLVGEDIYFRFLQERLTKCRGLLSLANMIHHLVGAKSMSERMNTLNGG